MLGDHVRSVALLAAGVVVLRIVERPEPVLVAAVAFLDRVERASVSAVAGRAAELFERMILSRSGSGWLVKGASCALGQAQVGLGQRHQRRHHRGIGAHVAGLAAVHQAHAADIVDLRAGGIHVDLAQLDVHVLDAVQQAFESRRTKPGRFSLTYSFSAVWASLAGLSTIAALGDQSRRCGHQAGERGMSTRRQLNSLFRSILPSPWANPRCRLLSGPP